MKWHEKFTNPLVFGFSSEKYGRIEWSWKNQEKQWHQNWLAKKNDVVIHTKLSAEDKEAVLDEFMTEVDKENRRIKDRNNQLAKNRRAKK
tara:strand:+ start:1163 stop:1432 length:270 start_codon:yes stop_codon:yes gene_type:complete